MKLSANGIELEVEVHGPENGAPLLLIMGLGMQLTAWPDEMVQGLVARGFRVIRHDNRDAGLSQQFDHLGVPNLALASVRHLMHLPVTAPYSLADMAADAAGVLDALNLPSAHVCGASLGGMVAQHLAATQPQRVRSLTLMMTTSGARRLPEASLRVRKALITPPRSQEPAAVVEHLTKLMAVIGSPGYPSEPERLRQRLHAAVMRAYRPAGTARQLMAVVADGDRTPMLGRIQAPTLVLHGAADPLIPPGAAQQLLQHIAGAQLDLVPGMGHDLPLPLLPRIVAGLAGVAGLAEQARAA